MIYEKSYEKPIKEDLRKWTSRWIKRLVSHLSTWTFEERNVLLGEIDTGEIGENES